MEDFQKSSQEFWPTEEDFKPPSEVLKWRDIENGIYKIHCLKEIWHLFRTRNEHKIERRRI